MQRAWLAIFLVAGTLGLAGCSDAPSSVPDSRVGGDGGTTLPAPEWALGSWWTMTDGTGNTYSLVVAESSGSDWIVHTDNKALAWVDRAFDISYVGPMSKDMLEGRQGADRVRYFDFPLTDGKNWTTQWDGIRLQVSATERDDGSFALEGRRDDGSVHVAYTYEPDAGFFGNMDFMDANGSVQYTVELMDHGTEFSGTLYEYDVPADLAVMSVAPGETIQEVLQVPDAQGDLAAAFEVTCGGGNGTIFLGLTPPDENGAADPLPPLPFVKEPVWGVMHECPADGDGQGESVLEPVPGGWRLDAIHGGSGGNLEVHVAWRPFTTIVL